MGRRERLQLNQLSELSVNKLKEEWARWHRTPTPSFSANLLRLGIAYKLQETRHGGISRETKRILVQTSEAAHGSCGSLSPLPPRRLSPGTRLVRDWHGAGHTVTVLEKGFEYDGKNWRSLTAIAKAITGTHRNGPRFFELTQ